MHTNTTFEIVNDKLVADCGVIVCYPPGPTTGVFIDPDIGCIDATGECLVKFNFAPSSNNTCTKNVDEDMQSDNIYSDITVTFDTSVASLEDNYPEMAVPTNIISNVKPPEMTHDFIMHPTAVFNDVARMFGEFVPHNNGLVTGSPFDLSQEFLIDTTLTDNAGNIFMGPPVHSIFIDAIGNGMQGFEGCMALITAPNMSVIPTSGDVVITTDAADTAEACCAACYPSHTPFCKAYQFTMNNDGTTECKLFAQMAPSNIDIDFMYSTSILSLFTERQVGVYESDQLKAELMVAANNGPFAGQTGGGVFNNPNTNFQHFSPPPPMSPPSSPALTPSNGMSTSSCNSAFNRPVGCACTSGGECASYNCNYTSWTCEAAYGGRRLGSVDGVEVTRLVPYSLPDGRQIVERYGRRLQSSSQFTRLARSTTRTFRS